MDYGTCHTYRGPNDTWWSCQGCYSAIEYFCVGTNDDEIDDDCGWSYTHGLNPGNPRAAENARHCPPWLDPEEIP